MKMETGTVNLPFIIHSNTGTALEIEAIPIDWIQRKLTEYICSGKYSSDRFPIVYSLIADWRKENEESLAE